MIKEFKTRTGAIYCDTEKRMEYLYVGDYGKENNIKADFLGFTREINSVAHHAVDLSEKNGCYHINAKRLPDELYVLRLPQSKVWW